MDTPSFNGYRKKLVKKFEKQKNNRVFPKMSDFEKAALDFRKKTDSWPFPPKPFSSSRSFAPTGF
jgi:hypothetical protein